MDDTALKYWSKFSTLSFAYMYMYNLQYISAKLLHHSVVTPFYNFTSLEVVPCSKTTMHYSDVQRTLM